MRTDKRDLEAKLKDLNQKIKSGELKLVIAQEKRKEFNRQRLEKIRQFFGQ